MYWSNIFIKATIAGLLLSCNIGLHSCSETSSKHASINNGELFDIPTFIEREIALLKKANPKVLKSVSKDLHNEEKLISIDSWDNELSSFKSVDLRKGVYKGFINKDSTDNIVTYTFQSDDVDLSKVEIIYSGDLPTQIKIERKVNNLLYDTKEVLSYTVGKNYTVEKVQDVWILGESKYLINGRIQ